MFKDWRTLVAFIAILATFFGLELVHANTSDLFSLLQLLGLGGLAVGLANLSEKVNSVHTQVNGSAAKKDEMISRVVDKAVGNVQPVVQGPAEDLTSADGT